MLRNEEELNYGEKKGKDNILFPPIDAHNDLNITGDVCFWSVI